jgi:hypothetical protein
MSFCFNCLFHVISEQQKYVRLQVLTAVWLKVKTLWDVMPCRWANGLRCFEVLSSLLTVKRSKYRLTMKEFEYCFWFCVYQTQIIHVTDSVCFEQQALNE